MSLLSSFLLFSESGPSLSQTGDPVNGRVSANEPPITTLHSFFTAAWLHAGVTVLLWFK